jgi:hypothetical protein
MITGITGYSCPVLCAIPDRPTSWASTRDPEHHVQVGGEDNVLHRKPKFMGTNHVGMHVYIQTGTTDDDLCASTTFENGIIELCNIPLGIVIISQ